MQKSDVLQHENRGEGSRFASKEFAIFTYINATMSMLYNGQSIRLTNHALGYVSRRGFSQSEVEDAIRSAEWAQIRDGRFECRHDVPFNSTWNGKKYETKQIRPIFVLENDEIIVITVYTYYF